MSFTFRKEERLCSRRLIDQLYAEGHRLMAFPFSVQWLLVKQSNNQTAKQSPCQVMIVAPKRKFRHAVDRNHVRRLVRECYRQRKEALYAFLREHELCIVFSMVYIHNEILAYDQLGHKMDKLLAALEHDIGQKHTEGVVAHE